MTPRIARTLRVLSPHPWLAPVAGPGRPRSARRGVRAMRRSAVAATIAALALPFAVAPAEAAHRPPRTGFETSEGARWTGEAEERSFLAAVDRGATGSPWTASERPVRAGRCGSYASGRSAPGPPPCS